MKSTLIRKYGPFPLWVILLLSVVVLYFGIMFLRNRSASASNSLGTQNPKSNLGTGYGKSGGAGGFTFPDVLPNTRVGESTTNLGAPAPADTSAPAVAPLASADVTNFAAPIAPSTDTTATANTTVDSSGNVVVGYSPLPGTTYVSTANDPTNADSGFFVSPVTQKILPEPLPTPKVGTAIPV